MADPPMRSLVLELALAVRERVLPMLGEHSAREHGERAAGGDVTFEIDRVAEELVAAFLAEHAEGVAFYSEDRGLVEPAGAARWVLVVDPVDGTRPALAGLESCCVSVAAAALPEGWSPEDPASGPTMGDVSVGCVVEIPSGTTFLAERGAGLVEGPPVRLSPNARLERMFWSYGFRGRPARALCEVLAELIDASSVGGGSFDLGSASFDMTRLLTGQLDAYVEPSTRIVEEVPGMRAEFERIGGGAVLTNSPYDLAAAALCLTEAGAIVTDAHGESLARRPLLGSSAEFQMSCVASANPGLHELVLAEIETGMQRLRDRVAR